MALLFLAVLIVCIVSIFEFGEITKNNGHYAIRSHSTSSLSVPMDNPYATSVCVNDSNLGYIVS